MKIIVISVALVCLSLVACKPEKSSTTATAPAAESSPPTMANDTYPLATCVVSGEALGGMGDPYVFEHDGKQVKLCCKTCLKKFDKEPGKYMKIIEDAKK